MSVTFNNSLLKTLHAMKIKLNYTLHLKDVYVGCNNYGPMSYGDIEVNLRGPSALGEFLLFFKNICQQFHVTRKDGDFQP